MLKLTLDQLLPHPPLYTYLILISGLPLQSPLILTNLLFSTNFSPIVPLMFLPFPKLGSLLTLFLLHFKLLPLMVTLSFTLLAPLAMGVALQQSTVPFLNYLKSQFLFILLLNLHVLDFPFLLILLFLLLFLQSIAPLPPLFLISSPISPLFSRILPLLTPN